MANQVDEDAWAQLWDLLWPATFSRAKSLTSRSGTNDLDAADVAIRAWEKGHRRIQTWKSDEGCFVFWLRRIVTNEGLDWLRRKGRDPLGHDEPIVEDIPDEVDAQRQAQEFDQEAVRTALTSLGQFCQLLLELRFYDGLSRVEIAEVRGAPYGTTEQNVGYHERKCLKRLRALLGPE